MKKCFTLIMVAVLLFSLSACGLRQPPHQSVESPANGSEMPSEVIPSESPILHETPSPVEGKSTDFLSEPFAVISDTFTYADAAPDASIFIEYIQVAGLADLEKQERINDILRQSVSSFTRDWENNPEISDLKTYEIYTEYAVIGNILSLQEMVSYYHSMAAHPWVALNSMTIDISTGEKLKLSDILIFSDSLQDKLTKEVVRPVKIVLDGRDESIIHEIFYDRLFDCIKDGYSSENRFYLTNDAIGFILDVPHAVGDFWTCEIAYDDLRDFLNSDFQVVLT